MKIKKILLIILVTVITITTFPFCRISLEANATNIEKSIKVYSENNIATLGETVKIPIYISNNTGLIGFKITLDYDYKILTPISVFAGDIISSGLQDNIEGDAVPGSINVYWSTTDNLYDNGIAFYVTFQVSETIKVEETSIALSYSQEDTFDENFNDVYLYCNDINLTLEKSNEKLWYESGLQITDFDTYMTSQSGTVEAGNKFLLSIDKFDGNTDLTSGTQTITYDSSNLIFTGYMTSEFKQISLTSAVLNNGGIEIITENGKTYNSDNPSLIFENLDIKYLVFKADEFAKSGDYTFEYSVTQDCGIETLKTSGCTLTVTPSAVSELARISIPNNISGNVDETIQIPVCITNNKGIIGYRLDFTYNPDELEILSVTSSDTFSGMINDTIGQKSGEFYVVWSTNNDDVIEDGVLLYISAKVLVDKQVVSSIGISYSQEDTFNDCFEDVIFNCIDGEISLNSSSDAYLITVKDINGNTVKEITVEWSSNTTFAELQAQLTEYEKDITDRAFVGWCDENVIFFEDDYVISSDLTICPFYEYNKLIDDEAKVDRTSENVYVTGLYSSGTTVAQLKTLFTNSEQIVVVKNNVILNDTDLVGTGCIVQCVSTVKENVVYEEGIIILYGDINGDGIIDNVDYQKLVGVSTCTDVIDYKYQKIAADVNKDGAIDAFDALEIDLQKADMHTISQV